MAKVPFSKLQASTNECNYKTFYCNKNGEEIYYEVKRYLPFKEKLDLISTVTSLSIDDNGFYNPMRVKLYMVLEIVYAYTNLSFTAKMKEDPFKLYDILVSTGIFQDILNNIAEQEWIDIQSGIKEVIDNYYSYRNSVMGVLESVSMDYNNLDLDAKKIQESIKDPESLGLLKDILNKLG